VLFSKTLRRVLNFIARQERPFRVNLFRVSIQNFFVSLTQQYQSIFITGLGATPFQVGILNSAGGLAGAAIAAPTGWLADRRGIKDVMLFGMIFMLLGTLSFVLAPDWTIVVPAMIMATLGLRVEMTACPMVCGTYLKSEERATGMQFCDTLSALPRLVSPIVGAAIIAMFGGMGVDGIRPLYYIQLAGFLLVLFIVWKIFDSPRRRDAPQATSFVSGMREVLEQGDLVWKWIIYICFSTIPMYVNPVYIPLYATELKNADQFVLGGMAAASTIVPLIFAIPVGHWADTVGRKKVIYATTLFHCVSLFLLIYAPDTTMLLASSILQGFFMLGAVTQGAMSAEMVPVFLLGTWYGILGLFRGFVSVATPAIGGLIWDSIGPDYVFVFLIVTELVKMLLLSGVPETLKIREV